LDNKVFHNIREDEVSSFKDYLNLVRLNIVPILLISLTGLIVASVYAYNAVDIYKSTTVLKLQKPQGSIISSPLMPEFTDWGNDRFIANEIEILKSYRMRDLVAQRLADKYTEVNDINSFSVLVNKNPENGPVGIISMYSISSMLENVTIEQKRGLDIVEITIKSPSAFEAALIANAYAGAYEELNLTYNRQQLVKVKDFLEAQKTEKLDRLIESEENFKDFQEQGGMISIDEQARVLIEALTNFESQRDATAIDLSIAEGSLKEYKKELKEKNPSIVKYVDNYAAEPRLKKLQESIAQLETQRDIALANVKGSYSDTRVDDYESSIKELKTKVDDILKTYKASLLAASPEELKQLSLKVLEGEVNSKSLNAKYKSLNELVTRYERKFNELPSQTIEFARFKREVTAYEKLYQLVEERYQEAQINEQSTPSNVLIIDEARVPLQPSQPNRMLIVIAGLVLGIGMGVGFAFVKNYFDNTVKTPEDIQNNNINVLAWVPQIEVAGNNGSEFEFIVSKKPDSIHSEAFRALRSRIQFSKVADQPIKTILVTSSAPREGKTLVAVNTGGSFAQANKKTLVLDCDLRKPRMHSVFNTDRFPGFSDYFFGQVKLEEIINKSDEANLYYITAGTIPPNPSEILSSAQMENFLEELKQDFDIIVIDSPPIIAVTDSEILSRLVDSTILVVSANETETELMKKSAELLNHEKKSFIGVLLNNFSYKSGYGSYYKYYYYYSHHGGNGAFKKKINA
jgi:tyrosine-protein kinase Etk/Wzc